MGDNSGKFMYWKKWWKGKKYVFRYTDNICTEKGNIFEQIYSSSFRNREKWGSPLYIGVGEVLSKIAG